MVTTVQGAVVLIWGSAPESVSRLFFDDTFAGIHRLDWFDYSLLIPYFVLLGILSLYGLNRYATIARHLIHREARNPKPARKFEQLPRVTIQLPLYNERFVVERLLDAVTRIRYPRELLQIQVLDDSTDETRAVASRLVGQYRAQGHDIEYRHRTDRTGFKAGALEAGMETATGELIAIFDADFVPNPDFLERTVHHFTDPKIGMVQTRWTYLNRNYSLLTEVQALMLDAHFLLEHTARASAGLFFNFNGTAGILRKEMITDAGGWQHDTLTEDCDLSYRAQVKGWKFRYLPDVESPSELPVETYSFQTQQSRWAKGLTQVALKLLPQILRAPISLRHKIEAFLHLTPNVSYPVMILVSVLILPVMILRFHMGWFEMLLLDLPIILLAFCSLWVFYLYAQHVRDRQHWSRAIILMPMIIAAGIGLTVINSRAFMEAVLRIPTEFARTAKYVISGPGHSRSNDRTYHRRSGLLPFVEILFGAGFLGIVWFAIGSYNFLAVPFLLLFVGGYFWAGFSTLYEEHQGRLRWQQEQQVETETVG